MTRIISIPIRIVDKPLHGEKGSPESYKAEQVKRELQDLLESLADSSNSLQISVEALEEEVSDSGGRSGLHLFHLMGA